MKSTFYLCSQDLPGNNGSQIYRNSAKTFTHSCRLQITQWIRVKCYFKIWEMGKRMFMCIYTSLHPSAEFNLSKLLWKQIFRGSTVVQTNFFTNIHIQTPVSVTGKFICLSQPFFTPPVFAGWSIEPFLSVTHLAMKSPPSYYVEIFLCLSQQHTFTNTQFSFI